MPVSTTNLITAALTLVARPWEYRAKGQGLVEYALILSFVSVLAIVALQLMQPAISSTLNNVSNSMQVQATTRHPPCPTHSPGGSGAAPPASDGCGNGGG